MRLVSCEHPKRVYNKYLGEYVWTACKECPTCLRRYQTYWCNRLENERKTSLFTLFVTLTYDENHLPRLVRDDFFDGEKVVEAYRDKQGTFCIPFSELRFKDKADLNYFNSKMHHGGVPYARFRDVQLFLKRFNKYLYSHYTQHYENFRYFVVSELGKESLRPHYHGLFFFRSPVKTKDFAADISACWQQGSCKVEVVESTAASYVSKYVGKPSFYPSFYQHNKIRNKFICSKRTPIGSEFELSQSPSEIFHNTITQIPVPRNGESKISMVSLPSYVENRLFPKCPRYATLSHTCRTLLYRCASRFHGKELKGEVGDPDLIYYGFDYWLSNLRAALPLRPDRHVGISQLYCLLAEIADGFSERGINALRRLYYLSKRVCLNCKRFFVSLDYYVQQIEKYWDKKEYECLTKFFEFQRDYARNENSEELFNMYLEFSFQNQNSGMPLLSECRDYKAMCLDNASYQRTSFFSHFKNALLDSCRCNDRISKNLTLTFYYAKKCNEVIEAIT